MSTHDVALNARGVEHDANLCAHGLRRQVALELGAHGAAVKREKERQGKEVKR